MAFNYEGALLGSQTPPAWSPSPLQGPKCHLKPLPAAAALWFPNRFLQASCFASVNANRPVLGQRNPQGNPVLELKSSNPKTSGVKQLDGFTLLPLHRHACTPALLFSPVLTATEENNRKNNSFHRFAPPASPRCSVNPISHGGWRMLVSGRPFPASPAAGEAEAGPH